MVILVVATVQGLAVLGYLWVERRREAGTEAPLHYERMARRSAADLSLLRPDGSVQQLAGLRGKTVLLHFWATWCPPCREELPGLIELSRDLARDMPFVALAVSLDDNWAAVRDFFHGELPPEVFRAEDGAPARHYQVSTLPDTYLIAADGSLRLRFGGARNWRTTAARDLVRQQARRQ
jgi:thiol-disulfide isomerase/thioredoxin